ncbi:YaaA family protein [Acholeplasma laidlawii]|uniref:YaaA family protein n=1 Tax=Acholeplasma laidlawii TaxID=2148 RepID=UPI0015AEE927|nr:YaaA family protein [Acholeplasma laidlawii]NWH12421.1 YaaA family protein [Acholeplasma laidlawii]NWH13807.1 YaaA family protein [Acholeplasma laidlawii]NWH15092.1 YaaA family protein [Acholeplasma laidlawii]
MTIIFAPTKLFNPQAQTTENKTMFETVTMSIVEEIQKIDKANYKKHFNLSDNLVDTVYNYYHNFESNNRFTAFDYYLGESFKAFNFNQLDDIKRTYLNDNVYIIDALYGVIKPLDGIKPYRMDFTLKQSKSVWRDLINNYFSSKCAKQILSLASKEFSALIDKSKFELYEVSFIDCKEDVCKKISVFNKQMRGKLLRYIVDHEINDISGLPKIILGYHLTVVDKEINYIKSV